MWVRGRKERKPATRLAEGQTETRALKAESVLCVRAKLLKSCPTRCDPMDCSPPGSSVHGILQARIMEWVAVPASSSTQGLNLCLSPAMAGRFFFFFFFFLPLVPAEKPIDSARKKKK